MRFLIGCGDVMLKIGEFMRSVNKEYFYLISLFIVIISIKFIVSLNFPSPWIFADETVYAENAKNIINGNIFYLKYCQQYPPGYSIFLSMAYIFSDDMAVVYRIMLLINCIITTSIIFPSYFILRKFCDKKFSFLGSATIVTLPSVTLYTFVLMSENLFIPLFLFSAWFLLESYSDNRKTWDFLAGISIIYLFLTRAMGVAMIVGFLISFIFYALTLSKQNSIVTILKEKYILIISIAAPILIISIAAPMVLWIYYKSTFLAQSNIIGYNTELYYTTLLGIFCDADSFEEFVSLFLHEMEVLILSSYFVVFYLACLLILNTSKIFKSQLLHERNLQNCQGINTTIGLTSLVIYVVVSSFIIILITVVHMHIALANGNQYYLVFGRYIDPIVPFIFLFGIIGYYLIYNDRFKISRSNLIKLTLLYVIVIIIFIFTFPYEHYKFPNMLSIFYIQYLKSILPIETFILAFSSISFGLFYFAALRKTSKYYLFLFLILTSILVSVYPVQLSQIHSFNADQASQIGKYLNEHSEEDTLVLMDRWDGWPLMWFSTIFWMNGDLIHHPIKSDPSSDILVGEADYIISSKILPYQPATCSIGYKLYEINAIQNNSPVEVPFIIDIGLGDDCIIENFHSAENKKIRWTKGSSKILIKYPAHLGPMKLRIKTYGFRPEDNPANIEWHINDIKIREDIKLSESQDYTVIISDKILNKDYQLLTIASNTWRPSDYGSADTRDLGVQVDWVEVDRADDRTENKILGYYKGWHDLEDWDGTPMRWMEDDSALMIYSVENRTVDLSFNALSFYRPRPLEIYVNDDHLLRIEVQSDGFVTVNVPMVSLNEGANLVRFHVPEGCERPSDIPELDNLDSRCLSLAVHDVKIIKDILVNDLESSSISLGDGWHSLEDWDGTPTRWMENDAALIIESEENLTAELSLQVSSFSRPRTLEMYLGDAPELREMVNPSEFGTIRTVIHLKEGTNLIRLSAREGCERPSDIPDMINPDGRCLSLAFRDVELQ